MDHDPTVSAWDYVPYCTINGAAGQATRIAAATGGVHLQDVPPADIAGAILDAVGAVEVMVEMTSDCVPPIYTSFDPAMVTATSGEMVEFTETISVGVFTPPGTYTCSDWVLIDGQPMTDASGAIIYETKTIHVPANFVTGGGHITEGNGKNRVSVLQHGGNAGFLLDGTLVGHWNFEFVQDDLRIQTTDLLGLQFSDEPAVEPDPPEAGADTALLASWARYRQGNEGWQGPCLLFALFQDGGEPQEDYVAALSLACGDALVFELHGPLTGGNIQVHDGYKG